MRHILVNEELPSTTITTYELANSISVFQSMLGRRCLACYRSTFGVAVIIDSLPSEILFSRCNLTPNIECTRVHGGAIASFER